MAFLLRSSSLLALLACGACAAHTADEPSPQRIDQRADAPSFSAAFDPQAPLRLASAWSDWKASWVTRAGAGDGARVLFQDGSGKPGDAAESTVSEAIGYGMLLAVAFDEQALFDEFNRYFLAHRNEHGLMGWKVLADGSFAPNGGSSSATDADEDIAAALVLADRKWSGTAYHDEAVTLANLIMKYDVDSTGGRDQAYPSYAILGGDWNTSAPADFNPSYFAPAWYRLFQDVTGDDRWAKVIDEGYALLALAAHPTTGLVPQDEHLDGSAWAGQGDYEYNAFRAPFRLAVDQAWNGEARARERVAKIASFYAGVINADHSNLYEPRVYATRKLDGTVLGGYEAGGFTATTCVALLASGDTDRGRYLYDVMFAAGRADDSKNYYYDGAWHLFGALFASGNYGPPDGAPAPSPTPSPSPEPTPDPSPSPAPAPSSDPTFTIAADATPNPVEAGQVAHLAVSLVAHGASLADGIVDLELFDAAGTRAAQTWAIDQSLPDGATRTVTFDVRAPGALGAYSMVVGVFAPGWAKNYAYVQAGTLTVSRGP